MKNLVFKVGREELYGGKRKFLYITDFNNQMYFYCPECKMFEPMNISDSEYYYLVSRRIYKQDFICSTCNKTFKYEDYYMLTISDYGYKVFGLDCYVFQDNKDILTVSILCNVVFLKGKKVSVISTNQRLTINCKTGSSYIFEPRTFGKRLFFYEFPRIVNCTYNLAPLIVYSIPTKVYEFLKKRIYKIKSEYFKFQLNTLEEYKEEEYKEERSKRIYKISDENAYFTNIRELNTLLIYNRFPLLNSYRVKITENTFYEKKVRDYRKIKASSTDPIGDFINILKLPNQKSVKKICKENFIRAKSLSKFNKVFAIKRAINLSETYITAIEIDFVPFLKSLVRHTSEKEAYKKLMNLVKKEDKFNSNNLLRDISLMYNVVKKSKNFKKVKIDFNKSMQNIHDDLQDITIELGSKKNNFKYTTKEKNKVKYSNKQYSIRLTKNNHELSRIGSKMHICVGAYSKLVLSKHCAVAIMTDKEKRYVACIELDPELNKVKQVKGYCNQLLKGEQKEFVEKWIQEKDLIIETYDLGNRQKQVM